MVTINVSRNGFTVNGHASYSESGKDIVCSAVSALTQAALLGLNRFCQLDATVEDGNIKASIFDPNYQTKAILTAMYLGLKKIQNKYPTFVSVQGKI